MIRVTISSAEALLYYQVRHTRADLPTQTITTPFNVLFRQTADFHYPVTPSKLKQVQEY